MSQDSFDVEALRKDGMAEERFVRLAECACALAIDIRSKITCELSANDGEWSSGEPLPPLAEEYKAVMAMALEYAECASDQPERLVWELMKREALRNDQPTILPW